MQVVPAKKRQGIYKFITCEDLTFKNTSIQINFTNEWLQISENGDVVVKGSNGTGYAWDGCTPKWNIFDLFLVGTPDGRTIVNTGKPITYYASLIHDVLCQFHSEIGISRKEVDKVFLLYLGDFSLRYLYYFSVRSYGVYLGLKSKLLSMLAN